MISVKSKITAKVLNYFFLNPDESGYINELARKLDLDAGNLYRKLKELEAEGLLTGSFRGREKYYSLAKGFPLLEHYRQIFLKTSGLEKKLKDIMRKTKGVRESYVFGSYARDSMDASSDIDILAVGDHSILELQKRIIRLQKESGREINVVNLSKKEYLEKRRNKDQFLRNIFSGRTIKL